MKIWCCLLSLASICCTGTGKKKVSHVVLIIPAEVEGAISTTWREALVSRMSKPEIDSLAAIHRPLSEKEKGWKKLFERRALTWAAATDSLEIPFEGIVLKDTIFVLTGFLGNDDAFTYQENNICFDLTAFAKVYGDASNSENEDRADRIFSHEYTHLLHKSWAKKNRLTLPTFRDSVLWECLYEGIGMYRSFRLPLVTATGELTALGDSVANELYPQFVDHISLIHKKANPTGAARAALKRNLSRGSVRKKWGATSVGMWLAMEANGDDRKLVPIINEGPASVLKLALKYLDVDNRKKLLEAIGSSQPN